MAVSKTGIAFEVENVEELARKLEALAMAVSKVLEPAVTAGAQVIHDAAEPRAPGPHIEVQTFKRSAWRVAVDVGVDKDHWHYAFKEYGAKPHTITGVPLMFEGDSGTVVTGDVSHPGMAAEPFLRPAVDEKMGEAVAAMADAWADAIEGEAT